MVGDVKIIPVILSGGAGSRLWPASRQAVPKQLLPLVTAQTMVQETAERFSGELFHPPVFICNAAHGPQIKEQMAAINVPVGAIIVEPIGRNTAPWARRFRQGRLMLRHSKKSLTARPRKAISMKADIFGMQVFFCFHLRRFYLR